MVRCYRRAFYLLWSEGVGQHRPGGPWQQLPWGSVNPETLSCGLGIEVHGCDRGLQLRRSYMCLVGRSKEKWVSVVLFRLEFFIIF